jgi:hypothetical protein
VLIISEQLHPHRSLPVLLWAAVGSVLRSQIRRDLFARCLPNPFSAITTCLRFEHRFVGFEKAGFRELTT